MKEEMVQITATARIRMKPRALDFGGGSLAPSWSILILWKDNFLDGPELLSWSDLSRSGPPS